MLVKHLPEELVAKHILNGVNIHLDREAKSALHFVKASVLLWNLSHESFLVLDVDI